MGIFRLRREMEPILTRAISEDLDRAGLGLRLRYLSGGMSDDARTIDRYVLPERGGYYVGARLAEAAIAERGISWAVRASADDISGMSSSAAATA
jgi:hypothetical protein